VLPRPHFSTLFPYTTLFRSCFFDFHIITFPSGSLLLKLPCVNLYKKRFPAQRHRTKTGVAKFFYLLRCKNVCAKIRLARQLLLRSEEHTSELQSRFELVCRL